MITSFIINKFTLLIITLYLCLCFCGNYIFTTIYYYYCTNIISYNSPICMSTLTSLSSLSILYSYIWYILICTIILAVLRHVNSFISR